MASTPTDLRILRIPFSTNVERVALALAHKGLHASWVDVDPLDRGAVLEVSGQELVPVLVPADGAAIADSMRIVAWLEEQVPEPALWPADAARRAETDVFLAWFEGVWKHAPNAIDDERLLPRPDHQAIARHTVTIASTLSWFESLLSGRDFLLGDTFGAADVSAFPFLKYGTLTPSADDVEPLHWILAETLAVEGACPRLADWIARVDALPRA